MNATQKPITIFDTTLRDGMQTPGIGCNLEKRIAIAQAITTCKPEYIEIGMPANQDDFQMMFDIAKSIYDINPEVGIAALCRNHKYDVDRCKELFVECPQKNKIAHIFIPTSDALRQYSIGKTKEEVIQSIKEIVPYAKNVLGCIIESTPEDAASTEPIFLEEVVKAKIDSGATRINLPDTTGWADVEYYADMYKRITSLYPDSIFHNHAHDDDGCGVAKVISAVKNGSTCIEGTVLGIGERAGNADWMVAASNLLHKRYPVDIEAKKMYKAVHTIANIIGYDIPPNYPIFGKNCSRTSSGIHGKAVQASQKSYHHFNPDIVGAPGIELVLGQTSGAHIVKAKLDEWRISYSYEKIGEITAAIKRRGMEQGEVTKEEVENILCETSA